MYACIRSKTNYVHVTTWSEEGIDPREDGNQTPWRWQWQWWWRWGRRRRWWNDDLIHLLVAVLFPNALNGYQLWMWKTRNNNKHVGSIVGYPISSTMGDIGCCSIHLRYVQSFYDIVSGPTRKGRTTHLNFELGSHEKNAKRIFESFQDISEYIHIYIS